MKAARVTVIRGTFVSIVSLGIIVSNAASGVIAPPGPSPKKYRDVDPRRQKLIRVDPGRFRQGIHDTDKSRVVASDHHNVIPTSTKIETLPDDEFVYMDLVVDFSQDKHKVNWASVLVCDFASNEDKHNFLQTSSRAHRDLRFIMLQEYYEKIIVPRFADYHSKRGI